MEEDFVCVHRPKDEMEARIIKALLEDNGIAAYINDFNASTVFDGAIAMAEGSWGEVLVQRSQAAEAAAILERYEKADETDGEESQT